MLNSLLSTEVEISSIRYFKANWWNVEIEIHIDADIEDFVSQ